MPIFNQSFIKQITIKPENLAVTKYAVFFKVYI